LLFELILLHIEHLIARLHWTAEAVNSHQCALLPPVSDSCTVIFSKYGSIYPSAIRVDFEKKQKAKGTSPLRGETGGFDPQPYTPPFVTSPSRTISACVLPMLGVSILHAVRQTLSILTSNISLICNRARLHGRAERSRIIDNHELPILLLLCVAQATPLCAIRTRKGGVQTQATPRPMLSVPNIRQSCRAIDRVVNLKYTTYDKLQSRAQKSHGACTNIAKRYYIRIAAGEPRRRVPGFL
jgi:hypothetical protein